MDLRLELEGPDDIVLEGVVEILLPEYFSLLPEPIFSEVQQAPQRAQMILACGRADESDDIELLTGDGRLMWLSLKKHGLPATNVAPSDWGHYLKFDGDDLEVASEWVISVAHLTVKA